MIKCYFDDERCSGGYALHCSSMRMCQLLGEIPVANFILLYLKRALSQPRPGYRAGKSTAKNKKRRFKASLCLI
jgi:hypothetical protein